MDFKLDLLYRKKPILGLDMGSSSIKVAQVKKKNGKIFLVGCGILSTDDSIFDETGEIKNPAETAKKIKQLISNPSFGKINAKRTNISIPESKIFTRTIDVTNLIDSEVEHAVSWELEQYVPLPARDLYVDWTEFQIVGEEKDRKTQIMIAAVPKKLVDSYLEVLSSAGLEPFCVEMNLQAISRAIISRENISEAFLLVDIGGDTSSLAIYDGTIRLTGSALVGGREILGKKNQENDPDVSKTEMQELAEEIKKMIDYYGQNKSSNGREIAKIFVSGGIGTMPGVIEEIGKVVGIPTLAGDPWSNISTYPLKPIPKNEAPRYSNAVGLALKELL